MTPGRQTCVRLVASVAAATVVAVVGGGAVALSDDPVSASLRPHVERGINAYLEGARVRAAADKLGWVDKAVLHFGVLGGGVVGQLVSPEGVAVLWHAVYDLVGALHPVPFAAWAEWTRSNPGD